LPSPTKILLLKSLHQLAKSNGEAEYSNLCSANLSLQLTNILGWVTA